MPPVVRIGLLGPGAAVAQGMSGRESAQVTSDRPQRARQAPERGHGAARSSMSGMKLTPAYPSHQWQPGHSATPTQASNWLRSGYRG